MIVEADRGLSVLVRTNKEVLSSRRAMNLTGGIDKLLKLQAKENRDFGEERGLAQVINKSCNCDGSDEFSSRTFLSFVSCSSTDPILQCQYVNKGGIGLVTGKLLFQGLVQGDNEKPWEFTADKNEWYLKFGSKVDVEYNSSYYAPLKGLEDVVLGASAF